MRHYNAVYGNAGRGLEAQGAGMANQTGKRYYCERCGSEFIVTTGGSGEMTCCEQPVTRR